MKLVIRTTQIAFVAAGALGALAVHRAGGQAEARGGPEVAVAEVAPSIAEDVGGSSEEGLGRRAAILIADPLPAAPVHAAADVVPRAPEPMTGVLEPARPTEAFKGESELGAAGEALFEREWTAEQGLGSPVFNAASCSACHHDPVVGGAGAIEFNVVQAQGRGQSMGAGALERYLGSRRGRSDVTLDARTRERLMTQLKKEHARGRANGDAGLQTPSLLGLGLVDTIPDAEIAKNADPDDLDGDGVRGVVSRVAVRGAGARGRASHEIGRFGWTAEVPRLADFVALALGGETGITVPDQGRGFSLTKDADRARDPEMAQSELDELVTYMAGLAPPKRAGRERDAAVETGRMLFESIGCAACHIPSLQGADGQPVELYSDLLLHEAVKLSKEESRTIAGKTGRARLRTPPLWGVRDTAPYLHHGLAETLRDAILAHDLEAKPARDRFAALLEYDAEAVVAFLNDL